MTAAVERMPRCCPAHEDWKTLSAHLVAEFPSLESRIVLTEITRSRDSVERFGLGAAEGLEVAEIIVRHQLMLLTGDIGDAARLDPESHRRRAAT